jgi:hypothetical protein
MHLSIEDLIGRLGGTGYVAERCAVAQNSVIYWKRRGRIPARYANALLSLAAERGVHEVTPGTLLCLASGPNPKRRRRARTAA